MVYYLDDDKTLLFRKQSETGSWVVEINTHSINNFLSLSKLPVV